jgi:hypothetical protein
LAAGSVTLLTSQWKSGKTTLVAVLLARLKAGGSLAGLSVTPAKAAVVSEEDSRLWYARHLKLSFADHLCLFCQPFPGRPSVEDWSALIEHLLGLRRQHGLDLLVIDTLAYFLPTRGENLAVSMLDALTPLRRLTAAGMSVLILHHPRKGETRPGQAARGSGSLAGFVDILVEMHWVGRPTSDDRRRLLLGYSRYEETPRSRVIELTADGKDYVSHGSGPDEGDDPGWAVLRSILAGVGEGLTRREIRGRWPAGLKAPEQSTLWHWLERAADQGKLLRSGAGRKTDPFRYRLPPEEAS